MQVQPVLRHGRWVRDLRGGGRAVRVSAHLEAGFLVLSTWKADQCVGTVRLLPAEAGELVAGIADGLVELASRSAAPAEAQDAELAMTGEHRSGPDEAEAGIEGSLPQGRSSSLFERLSVLLATRRRFGP